MGKRWSFTWKCKQLWYYLVYGERRGLSRWNRAWRKSRSTTYLSYDFPIGISDTLERRVQKRLHRVFDR